MAERKSAQRAAREEPTSPPPPSLGRIVHYVPIPEAEPLAALITRVEPVDEDRDDQQRVSLALFAPGVMAVGDAGRVPHEDHADAAPFWRWPERV